MWALSQPSITAPQKSYHMMFQGSPVVALDEPITYSNNLHHFPPMKTNTKKKGCYACTSSSVACRVEILVRRCEGMGCPISYCTEWRAFCSKHAPPPNLAQSGRFIDERQLMEFCFSKSSHGK